MDITFWRHGVVNKHHTERGAKLLIQFVLADSFKKYYSHLSGARNQPKDFSFLFYCFSCYYNHFFFYFFYFFSPFYCTCYSIILFITLLVDLYGVALILIFFSFCSCWRFFSWHTCYLFHRTHTAVDRVFLNYEYSSFNYFFDHTIKAICIHPRAICGCNKDSHSSISKL